MLVLDKDGEVLFHHKERTWGDHPSDAELLEAIGMLSPIAMKKVKNLGR